MPNDSKGITYIGLRIGMNDVDSTLGSVWVPCATGRTVYCLYPFYTQDILRTVHFCSSLHS